MKNQDIQNELLEQLRKTTTDIEGSCKVSITDSIKLKINGRKYFSILQLFESILAEQYQEEVGVLAFNNNESLVKFIYLGQVFLNIFCIQAIFDPDNIEYSCFELTVFYFALLQEAQKHKFNHFVAKLTQMLELLIHPENRNKRALVTSNVDLFQRQHFQEINLMAEQFHLFYSASVKGNITFLTKITADVQVINYRRLLSKMADPTVSRYLKQLLIKFLQFTYLDPIFLKIKTNDVIKQCLQNIIITELREDIKKNELIIARQKFYECLLVELNNRVPKVNHHNYMAVEVLAGDYSHLAINLVSFTRKHCANIKLCESIEYCIFTGCVFTQDNFNNTVFKNCIFIDCIFNEFIMRGSLTDCQFRSCKFENMSFEYLDINMCKFTGCNFVNTAWYRVNAAFVTILQSTIQNAAITFSNLNGAKFEQVMLIKVVFEGTNILLGDARNCQWIDVDLSDALYLSQVTNTEFLRVNINNRLQQLFLYPNSYQQLLSQSSDITTKLNHFIDEIRVDQNNPHFFRRFLGWILCATDRLQLYCDQYEKNKKTFNFKDTYTNFEILFNSVREAMSALNRYLTLWDRCHLSLMTQGLLKNSLFNNYQQYQEAVKFKAHSNLDDYFAENEKPFINSRCDINVPEYTYRKRESLLEIKKLPIVIKRIDDVLKQMQSKLAERPAPKLSMPRPS